MFMEQIYLSDSGPKVSPAIYGFYRWNEVPDAAVKMEEIVRFCLEQGINTFDHADLYGHYQCEELFGKLIRDKAVRREEIVLFSKCGLNLPDSARPDIKFPYYNNSREHILESVENSLRRLHTDYIDIFLLHHFDPVANIEETAVTLQELKDSGKIKNIGLANFSVFQHQLLASLLRSPIVTNHVEINLLNTSALDNGQIDYIKQKFMRPLATSPLAEGRISNGTDPLAKAVRNELESLAPKYNADIESLAVAWLIKLGALPLIGTTKVQRIKNIINSFSIDLERQDWFALYHAASGSGNLHQTVSK